MIIALLIPALLLVGVLMAQAYRNERRAVADKLLSTTRAISGVVDREFLESAAILKSLTASHVLGLDDLTSFDSLVRRALQDDKRWFVLGDENYRQLINTLVDSTANVPPIPEDPDLRATMQRGELYISNLMDGPVARAPVLHVTRPYFRDGRLKYTLHLTTRPADFAQSIGLQTYVPSALVVVVDRNHRIVARSREPEKFLGRTASPSMQALLRNAPEGVHDTVTLDGVAAITAFHRAPVSGWHVIVAAPRAELLASARNMLWLGLALSAFLIVFVAFIARWIGRGLAHGIDNLVASSERFARGERVAVTASGLAETDFVAEAMSRMAQRLQQTSHQLETALREEKEARTEAEALSEAARSLTTDLDLQTTVQKATDAATKLTGAKFGAFFYNLVNDRNESYVLYTLSGAPREAFEKFGLPRNTAVFAPTFRGEGVVRVPDITADPRYGQNAPHHGMPRGHLPVRSYLAVPVRSRNGEVLGGLFFGHPDPDVFTSTAERIAVGIAAHASIAVDNAKLYRAAQLAIERLNFSLSSLELGDWEWTVATDAMKISARTAAIYGLDHARTYTREEMRQALHADDRDRAREAAKHAAATGTEYSIEYRVNHPTLGLRWVATTGRPVFDADHKLTAMIGVVQDITTRKEAEMVLRTQNEVLEQKVAERTAQLRETIGELEAFSYSVSHDMRAPLRSMHSYAVLLQKDHAAALDDIARRYLNRISANAARLELLVRDVLAYSKVAKAEIDLQVIDLDAFIPSLVQQLPEASLPNIILYVERPLPRAFAHEAYLSQILSNLVGNAVKFTAPGRAPRVTIAGQRIDDHVKITIRDNGIGIERDDFERIFQIFGRVHSDQSYEGTGIGLAIVKKAVQRLGGDVGLESTVGVGTTFWFTLKAA